MEEFQRGTNNEMEYRALLRALQDPRSREATIYTDSQLLAGQLTERWKVKAEHLRAVHDECKKLLDSRRAKLVWVQREENRAGRVLERLR